MYNDLIEKKKSIFCKNDYMDYKLTYVKYAAYNRLSSKNGDCENYYLFNGNL